VELQAPIDIWEKNVTNREGEFWTRAERSRQLGTYLNYEIINTSGINFTDLRKRAESPAKDLLKNKLRL
jgi:hypothetical protein